MTAGETCIHCRIAEIVAELHPDGVVPVCDIFRVAQSLAEMVACEADAAGRRGLRDQIFSYLAAAIEDFAARNAAPGGAADLRATPAKGRA
ncbi:MAG: hypothetical protein Kow00114_27430 [Kiloniellaceae bacterium]